MRDDPIVEEIHKIRENLLAKFHGDFDALYRYLKEQEQRSGKVVISLRERQEGVEKTEKETSRQRK